MNGTVPAVTGIMLFALTSYSAAADTTEPLSTNIADGAILAESETRLTIATELAEAKTWMTLWGNPLDRLALSDLVEPIPPIPQRKPARGKTSLDIRTVKIMTVKPPMPKPPYDGAYALGEAAEAPAQWVEIVRAVNMHARAEQSSETVKVVEKGLKMRVTGRG